MARVPIHSTKSAPEGSRATLEALERQIGKVLNIHGAMAHSPTLLGLYAVMEGHLSEKSSLGDQTRQAIHLAVAAVNDCEYCQAAYTGASLAAGLTLDETLDVRRGAVAGREGLTALLELAREVATDKGHVADETWARALEAGWSEAQLLEGYAEVVRTVLTNYFNHMVGVELDLRPAPSLE